MFLKNIMSKILKNKGGVICKVGLSVGNRNDRTFLPDFKDDMLRL